QPLQAGNGSHRGHAVLLALGRIRRQPVWTLSLGLGMTSRQFTAELWGFLRHPNELTQRWVNPSGGSKPRSRERRRASARKAAQGGRFAGSELVLAGRREGSVGGQIGDKSRETRGKRQR